MSIADLPTDLRAYAEIDQISRMNCQCAASFRAATVSSNQANNYICAATYVDHWRW